jgi:hypothetical protein
MNLTTFQTYPLSDYLNIPSSPSSPPMIQYQSSNCSSLETMITFIEAPGHVNGMDNRQTRMLAGAKLEPDSPDSRSIEQL